MNPKAHKVLSVTLWMLAVVIFGAICGGFLMSKVFPGGGMGWDRLARVLGGLMVGGGLGVVVGGVAAWRLPPRLLYYGSAAAVVATALLYLLARMIPPL